MGKVFKNNGLSIVLLTIFAITLVGQYIAGWKVYVEDEYEHGKIPVSFLAYVKEPHFLEALFENWESEFLQMAVYVVFTAFLFQKGSSESKRPGVTERVDIILPDSRNDPRTPWPVRRGGIVQKLYEYSLPLTLLFLFFLSWFFHLISGSKLFNAEQLEHGKPALTTFEYLATPQLWFESFQNWQSEFLSIAVMVILTIFLRQRGSPESKPVDSPHAATGSE